VDLTQSFGWISSLDRALDAALATALERRIAVRYVTVIDDKKFVVKTS
jgi:predicted Zn-dependent protease